MQYHTYVIIFLMFFGLSTACTIQSEMPKDVKKLSFSKYHYHRNDLSNADLIFQQNKTARIAFLGGSITHNGGWRDSVEQYFSKKYPKTKFEFIRAGIPSMGSTPSAFRLERDVLATGKVDLLFQEAAVNDATNERTSVEQTRAMEGIVRHLRADNPKMDIVFMYFVDPDKMDSYRADQIPAVIRNHESVARHYNISAINLAHEVSERIDNQEFTWEDDFIDLHPSPFGQGVYARSIIQFLNTSLTTDDSTTPKLKISFLPKAMNDGAYDKGRLIDISNARYQKGWTLIDEWIPEDKTGTRDNYHHVPMLVNEDTGSELEFSFEGNTIGITVAAGSDAGIIEYSIDSGPWKQQNLFTKWSASLHLPWYYTLSSDLDDTPHVLRLRVSKDHDERSKGHACRIRYFYINQI